MKKLEQLLVEELPLIMSYLRVHKIRSEKRVSELNEEVKAWKNYVESDNSEVNEHNFKICERVLKGEKEDLNTLTELIESIEKTRNQEE